MPGGTQHWRKENICWRWKQIVENKPGTAAEKSGVTFLDAERTRINLKPCVNSKIKLFDQTGSRCQPEKCSGPVGYFTMTAIGDKRLVTCLVSSVIKGPCPLPQMPLRYFLSL